MSTQPQITPYPIRMEPRLRRALEDAAAANSRSLHAEIIYRLEGTLAGAKSAYSTLGLPSDALPKGWEEALRRIMKDGANDMLAKMDAIIQAQTAVNELQSGIIEALLQDLAEGDKLAQIKKQAAADKHKTKQPVTDKHEKK